MELKAHLIKAGQAPCRCCGWLHLWHPPTRKVISEAAAREPGEVGGLKRGGTVSGAPAGLKRADAMSAAKCAAVSAAISTASGSRSSRSSSVCRAREGGKADGSGGGARGGSGGASSTVCGHGSKHASAVAEGAASLQAGGTAPCGLHLFFVSGGKLFYLLGDPLVVCLRKSGRQWWLERQGGHGEGRKCMHLSLFLSLCV